MNERIIEFFEKEGIECFAALSYSDCRETNAQIIGREAFTPRSVILFLLPYYTGKTENLSCYAASFDYHIIIKDITARLSALISEIYDGASCKGYGDHSPIDECHAALIGGLGVIGDNGLLINEKYGSYVFIGDVVTDVDPMLIGAEAPKSIKQCEHCGRCRAACPTGILGGQGSDCLSAITQRKGELSDFEISLMKEHNTVWGCDECQSCCPHNFSPRITPIEFFHRERIPLLTSEVLAGMTKAEFNLRAFAWRGRKTVERNLEKLGF